MRLRVVPHNVPGAQTQVEGFLDYPSAWSSKGGVIRSDRHLGTIDAVVLACRSTELLSEGVDAVRSIDVRASSTPTLTEDQVSIALVAADNVGLSFRVGGMRVTVSMAGIRKPRQPEETPDWMTGWHTTSTARIQLKDVEVDVDAGSARATVTAVALEPTGWAIDSNAPSLSVADSIAAAGAITEVALFQRANVQRDAVGNFWMRRAHIEYSHPYELRSHGGISVSTVRSHVFRRDESRWHSARVRVECELGFHVDADVAFEERNSRRPPARA